MEVNTICMNLESYDELIENRNKLNNNVISLEQEIKNLTEKLNNSNTIEAKYKEYFIRNILENESYHVSRFLEEANKGTGSYHYQKLQNKYFEIGITDLNYIKEQIEFLVEQYKSKTQNNS